MYLVGEIKEKQMKHLDEIHIELVTVIARKCKEELLSFALYTTIRIKRTKLLGYKTPVDYPIIKQLIETKISLILMSILKLIS